MAPLLGVLFALLIGLDPAPAPDPASAFATTPEVGASSVRVEVCAASWYGDELAGNATASGVPFDPDAMTAAHRTLPLGTIVTVEHGGHTVTVEVNDRGPFADVDVRCLDLSRAAFAALAPLDAGVIDVEIRSSDNA